MQVVILATDYGPHPPEKWAGVTAMKLIDISATASETKLAEARAFQKSIIAALTAHHGKVIASERGKLATAGDTHYETEIDPTEHIDEAVSTIVAAAKGLSFEAHFAKPETQEYIKRVIGEHCASMMHIERSWASDEGDAADQHRAKHNIPAPGAKARAWKTAVHPGPAPDAVSKGA